MAETGLTARLNQRERYQQVIKDLHTKGSKRGIFNQAYAQARPTLCSWETPGLQLPSCAQLLSPSSHTGLPGHGSVKRDALSGLDSGDRGDEMETK